MKKRGVILILACLLAVSSCNLIPVRTQREKNIPERTTRKTTEYTEAAPTAETVTAVPDETEISVETEITEETEITAQSTVDLYAQFAQAVNVNGTPELSEIAGKRADSDDMDGNIRLLLDKNTLLHRTFVSELAMSLREIPADGEAAVWVSDYFGGYRELEELTRETYTSECADKLLEKYFEGENGEICSLGSGGIWFGGSGDKLDDYYFRILSADGERCEFLCFYDDSWYDVESERLEAVGHYGVTENLAVKENGEWRLTECVGSRASYEKYVNTGE